MRIADQVERSPSGGGDQFGQDDGEAKDDGLPEFPNSGGGAAGESSNEQTRQQQGWRRSEGFGRGMGSRSLLFSLFLFLRFTGLGPRLFGVRSLPDY